VCVCVQPEQNNILNHKMESESPLEVLSRAATMLHREETAAAESPYVCTTSEYLLTS